MKIRTLVLAAALGMGPAAVLAPLAMAQPQWDVVHVNLPYSVTLGKQTLAPGDYTIQQLRSDNSPVLLFYNGKNGMKFETSAMTIPAVGNTDNTPDKTTVSLHHVGDAYYMDKIFIQGKDYGYEFPLPNDIKAREKEMSAVSVPAQSTMTSTATDATTTTNSDATPPVTTDTTTTATDTTTTAPPTTVDNSTPPTPPVQDATPRTPPTPPEPQPTVDNSQPQTPAVSSDSSANREKRDTDDTPMPATSAGWLAMLLSGGTLSGVGMMLRRKR